MADGLFPYAKCGKPSIFQSFADGSSGEYSPHCVEEDEPGDHRAAEITSPCYMNGSDEHEHENEHVRVRSSPPSGLRRVPGVINGSPRTAHCSFQSSDDEVDPVREVPEPRKLTEFRARKCELASLYALGLEA